MKNREQTISMKNGPACPDFASCLVGAAALRRGRGARVCQDVSLRIANDAHLRAAGVDGRRRRGGALRAADAPRVAPLDDNEDLVGLSSDEHAATDGGVSGRFRRTRAWHERRGVANDVEVRRRLPPGARTSSKMLGGASQTVSKIRVKCNGKRKLTRRSRDPTTFRAARGFWGARSVAEAA